MRSSRAVGPAALLLDGGVAIVPGGGVVVGLDLEKFKPATRASIRENLVDEGEIVRLEVGEEVFPADDPQTRLTSGIARDA